MTPLLSGRDHVAALLDALPRLDPDLLDAWGASLAQVLVGGGRLLVAGNGGSAAQAQHLTAELVGRYRDDRPALSAIALHAETSAVTAIANDYGYDHVFARQVQAHGRPGDVYVYGQGANISMADWVDLIIRTGVEQGFWPDDRHVVLDEGRKRPGVSDVMALRVGHEKLTAET